MSLSALASIEAASVAVHKAANRAVNTPTAAPYIGQLVQALYSLETRAHADFVARSKRPLPAPDGQKVGSWASSFKANRAALAPIMHLGTPSWLPPAAEEIRSAAAAIEESIVAQRANQVAAKFSGAPAAPVAQVVAEVATNPAGARKALGTVLHLLAAGTTAGLGFMLHRYEKKMKDDGLTPDEDAEPEMVRNRSQRLLDNELPGSNMTLVSTPDGRWIASVRRGSDTVARHVGRKPTDAAGTAVERALEFDDLKKHPARAVMVERKAKATIVSPGEKPRKVKIERVEAEPVDEAPSAA